MNSLTQVLYLLLRFLVFLVGAAFLFAALPEEVAYGMVGVGLMFFAVLVEPGDNDDSS